MKTHCVLELSVSKHRFNLISSGISDARCLCRGIIIYILLRRLSNVNIEPQIEKETNAIMFIPNAAYVQIQMPQFNIAAAPAASHFFLLPPSPVLVLLRSMPGPPA